ncbi:MAG: ABC transporter permease [Chloroflexota bacterium]|nr:ABC transporter permease [Chloroflexota bacterium]
MAMEGDAAAAGVAGELVLRRQPSTTTKLARWCRKNPVGVAGWVLIMILLAMAAFADIASTHEPNKLAGSINELPSSTHYLGTDLVGRDIFSRLLHGARVSLAVGFWAVFMGVTAGLLLGLVSAYAGGIFDLLVQRLVDANIAIPGIVLALVIVAVLGPSVTNVIIALAINYISTATRVTRSVVLREKARVYVEAARSLGASSTRIMFLHVLPNSISPYLVLVSVSIGSAIIGEASLSFLGAGVGADTASWGSMLSTAAARPYDVSWTLALAPGMAIALAVLGFNLFADSLRDTLDPRLRNR